MTPVPADAAAAVSGPPLIAQWARYYCEIGMSVIPTLPRSKRALEKNWTKPSEQVTDGDTAERDWTAHPERGVAAVLGSSLLVSLDIDAADETALALAAVGIDVDAATLGAPTIVGRPKCRRCVFAAPQDIELKRKVLKWPPIDGSKEEQVVFELRAGRALDCLPPTIHPDTGNPYQWAVEIAEDDTFPPLPDALLDLWLNWKERLPAMKAACSHASAAPSPDAAVFKSEREARRSDAQPTAASVIDAFNSAHDVETLLTSHGYTRESDSRWRKPNSKHEGGVVVLDDGKVFSHHAGDRLACDKPLDAFDLWRVLAVGRSADALNSDDIALRADVREAATVLGLNAQDESRQGVATSPQVSTTAPNHGGDEDADEDEGVPYVADETGIYMIRVDRDGNQQRRRLANFDARIVEEVVHDDGAEERLMMVVEGSQRGTVIGTATVSAQEFAAMQWPMKTWGARCVVAAGTTSRDQLRHAIQSLSLVSGAISRRVVYRHTGWRRIEGEWAYLHADGALGADGNIVDVETSLDRNLAHYRLPDPPPGKRLAEAVRASLDMERLTPDGSAGLALLAKTYRAPLNEVLWDDHSIEGEGRTGTLKTELSSIGQAHFGDGFDSRSLPASWHDTPTHLELAAHAAKDALLVVDDYRPRGSQRETHRIEDAAAKLLHDGIGNRLTRGRRNGDLTARPAYIPRCGIVTTGEDVPGGHSLRARMLIVRLRPGDVDKALLTTMQGQASSGLLAEAMAGYVQWLAPRIDELREKLRKRHRELRERFADAGHLRTPSNVAHLMLGIEALSRFAVASGALDAEQAKALRQRADSAFRQVAADQSAHLREANEAERFLDLLSSALTMGAAHLADSVTNEAPDNATAYGWAISGRDAGGEPQHTPLGNRIGWIGAQSLMLDPQAAWAAVQGVAQRQHAPLQFSQSAVRRRLAEVGVLKKSGDNFTQPRDVGGRKRRVLVLDPAALDPEKPGGYRPQNP